MGLKLHHIESQKSAAEARLAARQALLREKGLDEAAFKRDPLLRKIKADVRQAVVRKARAEALEKEAADRARAKETAGGAQED